MQIKRVPGKYRRTRIPVAARAYPFSPGAQCAACPRDRTATPIRSRRSNGPGTRLCDTRGTGEQAPASIPALNRESGQRQVFLMQINDIMIAIGNDYLSLWQ
jgi:hypothetical protein